MLAMNFSRSWCRGPFAVPSWSAISRFAVLLVAGLCPALADAAEFEVTPSQVTLDGNFMRAQLLVSEGAGPIQDRSPDLTSRAQFLSADPKIVELLPHGLLLAKSNGTTAVQVTVDGVTKPVTVTVTGVEANPKLPFVDYVEPVLTKAGCNAGACHSSQHGKGGLILSVMGYDPEADHRNIVRDRMQRRVNLLDPKESLLLKKPALQAPHGGGKRLDPSTVDYQILEARIAGDVPLPVKDAPKVTKIVVTPGRRIMDVGQKQQLRVEATYSTGKVRDVSAWARYDSLDDGLIQVSSSGLVTAVGRGQAAVMVRFEGQAEISLMTVPYGAPPDLASWVSQNPLDDLARAKFLELGIGPSPLCDDATFLRRAYLDAIGTLPTMEETTAFLNSSDPNKRNRLVDQLLGLTGDPALDIYNDTYAAYWTIKWSDLIRNNSNELGEQGMWALHNWLRESFRVNKPFDQFVRELITAKGSIFSNGPANYFRISNNPSDLAESTTQLFLGVRLTCAKCHHHPFEKYSQDDYYSFAAFFSRVGNKNSQEFGLFGGETVVVVRTNGEVANPRTGKIMKPTPLDGEPTDDPIDRRVALAKWLTSAQNDYFAKNVVNRYVRYLLGRGLVEPIDDLRNTNPPTNPAMMDALVTEFRNSGFNLKKLMRLIMTSRLYQLDSQPTTQNAADTRFYSHYLVKRISAEPLLDAIDRATLTQTKFTDLPPGTRAIQLPDAEYNNYFLNTFGKPKRVSVCECERVPDENLSQALHTINGDILANKITDGNGRIAQLLKAKKPHEEIVRELYVVTLSRLPTAAEIDASQQFLKDSPTPAECYQDLLWALINSKQFLFVH